MEKLATVDPNWAWAKKKFADNGPSLGQWRHLMRRISFGADAAYLGRLPELGLPGLVDQLTRFPVEESVAEKQSEQLAATILASADSKRLASAWLYRLLNSPNQLVEKMTVFWHGHFATSAEKVTDAKMMWRQNQLLRAGALGDFGQLAQGIAKDPAMLVYLDSETNRKAHPNENFARELMELFCLGEGNYTERDVQELSRAFTGWSIRSGRFRKNKYQQDSGEKTVLGKSSSFDGEAAISVVVSHPECPRFLARKIFKYFVCDEPTAPRALIEPLAQSLADNDMRTAPVLAMLFQSNLFFSEHAVGKKIRSPVELVLGLLRGLDATTGVIELNRDLERAGQSLFFPPNVKGWDGGRAWINSATLLARANMMQRVVFAKETRFDGRDLRSYLSERGVHSTQAAVDYFESQLFAAPLTVDRKMSLQELAESGEDRYRQLLHAMVTLPEFQLG